MLWRPTQYCPPPTVVSQSAPLVLGRCGGALHCWAARLPLFDDSDRKYHLIPKSASRCKTGLRCTDTRLRSSDTQRIAGYWRLCRIDTHRAMKPRQHAVRLTMIYQLSTIHRSCRPLLHQSISIGREPSRRMMLHEAPRRYPPHIRADNHRPSDTQRIVGYWRLCTIDTHRAMKPRQPSVEADHDVRVSTVRRTCRPLLHQSISICCTIPSQLTRAAVTADEASRSSKKAPSPIWADNHRPSDTQQPCGVLEA